MNKMLKKLSVVCVLTMWLSFSATSQNVKTNKNDNQGASACSNTLQQAQKLYEQGQMEKIPGYMDACLLNGFTKPEKIQAYRLLVLTYLFQDNHPEAENSMLHLLQTDPEYQPNPAVDPIEYLNLYYAFRTSPIISIGPSIGGNYFNVNSFNDYGIGNTEQDPGTYNPLFSFQFGLQADLYVTKNLFLNTGVYFVNRRYEHNTVFYDFSRLTYTETQAWLDMPLMIKYQFGKKRFFFYPEIGVAGQFLLSSTTKATRVNEETKQNDAIGPDLNTKEQKSTLNYSAVVGGGVKYKFGYFYLTVGVRYLYGLSNLTNIENRYADMQTVFKYGLMQDDVTMRNFMFNVSFYRSLYKPKKIKSLTI